MISNAYAQNTSTPQANPIMSFVPFILIFVVFYFLMIRPQKKRMEKEKTFLADLKKGDHVYTKSGMIGTIVGITEKVVDLEVTQGVKLKILKSQVADRTDKLFAAPTPPREKSKK